MNGTWLTIRELSQATDIDWRKLRYLRETGVLTDLGMILYEVRCQARPGKHKYSKWWIWVPSRFLETPSFRSRMIST